MTNFEIAQERINYAKDNNLLYLDLSGLRLSKLPDQLSELRFLLEIDLSYNNLIEFPIALIHMTNIRILNISHNHLSDLPFEYGLQYSLQELDISYNFFNFIPDELSYLYKIESIIFNGNPFHHNLPLEIASKEDIFYIQFYLESLKKDIQSRRLFETKLLIVGKGDVGKTTLMKVIRDPHIKIEIGKEETTNGISIQEYRTDILFPAIDPYYNPFYDLEKLYYLNYEFDEYYDEEDEENYELIKVSENLVEEDLETTDIKQVEEPFLLNPNYMVKQNVKINIWDFGGQEILYSTHQFFLTQRSIYILVWEPRSDSYEENFDYWLNLIGRLGKDSPIIVVMNKSDISIKNIDESRYKKDFKTIIGFYRISCFTKEGINTFIEDLKNEITKLDHIGDSLPIFWDDVRKELSNIKKDYISYSDFKSICKVEDDKKANYISSYLSDLGDIIHFDNDLRLENLVIINPHWLTKAIYKLIHSLDVQKNNGFFKADDLAKLLNTKEYPKEKHLELLSLMEKFEICFRILGENNHYVLPALLKASPNDQNLFNLFKIPEALKYQVKYKHIPSGIIERLICRLNNYIEGSNYWKYGAIFNTEHARALVYFDTIKRKIFLYVIGKIKSHLYSLIQGAIKDINEDLKLNPEDWNELMACSCNECIISDSPHMFDLKTLKKFLSKNKETIDCQESTNPVSIRDLISGYRKTNNQTNTILREVIDSSSMLQSRHQLIKEFNENNINIYFQDLLRPKISNRGLFTNEQSLKGSSTSKKQFGELDINIETSDGTSITFYEGFILNSLNKSAIDEHITKSVKNYDSNGLREKFIGVYCYANNFSSLIKKYKEYVNTIAIDGIKFFSIEDLSKIYVNGTEIKVFRSKYTRNDSRLTVYHILINLNL